MSRVSRSESLQQLPAQRLDVLVIGGGIVGSGIARDAAMRGLRTGIIDRHDFAFGTSSRSSRLLHGGLRYLQQGRIGLVRDSSLEKRTLARIAPHLAQPLGFIFPTYRATGRPLWQLRLGVKLYDLLCSGRNFAPSSALTRDETLHALPALNPDGLQGAVRYFDALTNDARLVLDTLRSAARHGALAANYVRFIDAKRSANGWNCELEDVSGRRALCVESRALVNATGPWASAMPHSAVKLRLTKGIHIVVDQARLPVTDAVVLVEGNRLLFVLPWNDRVIIGTTDTDYDGMPEDVAVAPDDIDYLLQTVRGTLPGAALTKADIISSWAGLRPLIANPDGSPSDISRAHQIRQPEPGWWDVAGGKLTTYRLMAEQTVDQIVRHLGCSTPPCRTAEEPLLPANEVTPFSGIQPAPCTRDAVAHYVRNEWAVTLADVMVRRSGWHVHEVDPDARAQQVASWMEPLADWTPAQRDAEFTAYRALVATERRPLAP